MVPANENAADLTPEFITECKAWLEGEAIRLRKELSDSPAVVEEGFESPDRVEAIEVNCGSQKIKEAKLGEVLAALNRIENGTFGICAAFNCNKHINRKRLNPPYSYRALCVECQRVREEELNKRR